MKWVFQTIAGKMVHSASQASCISRRFFSHSVFTARFRFVIISVPARSASPRVVLFVIIAPSVIARASPVITRAPPVITRAPPHVFIVR